MLSKEYMIQYHKMESNVRKEHFIMSVIDKIMAKAKSDKKFILLPEGTEERTVQAAEQITKQGIAKVALIGNPDEIKAVAKKFNVDLTGVETFDPLTSPDLPDFIERFYEMRKE